MAPAKSIDEYILELLYQHECVILPGFGGFITNYKPAGVHPLQNRFEPPSKSVRFNINLKDNDGLLVNHLATREDISYPDAKKFVGEFSEHCLEVLNKGNIVQFRHLGSFTKQGDIIVTFKPEVIQNLNEGSFGLASIISPPINRKPEIKPRTIRFEDRKPRHKKTRFPASVKWTVSLAIPIMAFLLWGIINPSAVNQIKTGYTGMGAFELYRNLYRISHHNMDTDPETKSVSAFESNDIAEKHQPPEENITGLPVAEGTSEKENEVRESVTLNETGPESTNADHTGISKAPVQFKESPEEISQVSLSPGYYIIGGSFRDIKLARKFSEELASKGYDPVVMPVNDQGNIRVSYFGAAVREDVLDDLDVIRYDENPQAWLLKI